MEGFPLAILLAEPVKPWGFCLNLLLAQLENFLTQFQKHAGILRRIVFRVSDQIRRPFGVPLPPQLKGMKIGRLRLRSGGA